MTDDLIARLRALSRAEHDDLSVADEAADEIERLQAEVDRLRQEVVIETRGRTFRMGFDHNLEELA